MLKLLQLLVVCLLIISVLSAKKKPAARRSDVPKRIQAMKKESNINIQLVRTTRVEIGFSFIQGASGFLVSAKEWIDGKFEQSVATDSQILSVQKRSAVLRNLIPGREYVIQVQGTNKNRQPMGAVQEKLVRTAQMCYTCNGVEANEECDAARDVVECPADKDACLNVVRFDNDKMSITKRCAQYDPKLSKSVGNCGKTRKNSVCKCMCRSNNCNQLMLPCVDECMDELPNPLRSTIKCTNKNKVGSECNWACDLGFKLKGLRATKCRPDRTWSVMSPPECVIDTNPRPIQPRKCKPVPRNINANVRCTRSFNQGSVCKFTCKTGFSKAGGSNEMICRNKKWTGSPILCAKESGILCPSVSMTSGLVECSNSRNVGSICNIVTPSTMTCQGDGHWQSSHTCTQVGYYDVKSMFGSCETLKSPDFGSIKCSKENDNGSICKYICANGYTMLGETPHRECVNGKWTGSPAICQERLCGDVANQPLVESVLKCSHDDRIGSVCEVLTPASMTCQSDGVWSMPFKAAPKCKECSCP
uniref:P-selectin-like isoform X2 n=1 Tax=Styela clava TaxID=7725 RepID=UPI00193AAC14|nr:P-selectin-like isoform X2 [Styela clava]